MEFDLEVKLAIYRRFAEVGRRPRPEQIAGTLGSNPTDVLLSYQRLRAQRVLVLDGDGASIRMAPPFSGVPTQHRVTVLGKQYFANCAWDALGIPAALKQSGIVESRCGQSGEPYRLSVDITGPEPSDWLFHCSVPAAHWWDDIVFT